MSAESEARSILEAFTWARYHPSEVQAAEAVIVFLIVE